MRLSYVKGDAGRACVGVCGRLNAALLRVLGKQVKQLPALDMTKAIEECGLANVIPQDNWPPANACRELLRKVLELEKNGVKRPFVVADLKKFLPSWCPESVPVLETDAGDCDGLPDKYKAVQGKGNKRRCSVFVRGGRSYIVVGFLRRLELLPWTIAWDSYAVAAAMTRQLEYASAMVHKCQVLEVAVGAQGSERSALLGVLYDEVSRLSLRCVGVSQGITCRVLWQGHVGRHGPQAGRSV